jgi:hypothetical protein
MSAKIAVLGLVIEEPGPAHRLTAKLRQRLSSAGFVDSNVYSALTRLERDGLVRAIPEDVAGQPVRGGSASGGIFAPAARTASRPQLAAVGSHPAGAGRPSGSGYQAGTGRQQPGTAYQVGPGRQRPASRRRAPGSRADSRSFEATPAGVRHFEEWLLKSSTAPPLRDELHMKVALCQPHNLPRLVELVYGQELICLSRVEELKRTFDRMRPPAPNRWSGLVLVHIRDAELSFWDSRLTWLQGVRVSLEGMHAEYERATGAVRLRAESNSTPALPVSALASAGVGLAAYEHASRGRAEG